MPQSSDHMRLAGRAFIIRLMTITLLALCVPVTPSLAQASGQLRVKILKAGLLVGGGGGSGVLTYRGRSYPFRVTGVSLGITAGATVGRFDGWAAGIREIGDFAGTYSSVGGGAALIGGINGVHLRNDKGVTMVLQGPKAGIEFAANLSQITSSLR
jgi:hypothetical protein